MKSYIIVEKIEIDTFYDIAYIRVGFVEDQGVLLQIPIPKSLNNDLIYRYMQKELTKIFEYCNETMLRWIVESNKIKEK